MDTSRSKKDRWNIGEPGSLERNPFISQGVQKGLNYQDKFQRTKEEWKKFISGDMNVDHTVVSDEVFDSWARCRKLMVNPIDIPHHTILTGEGLAKLIQDNEHFINVSRPFMQNLYKFLAGSGFVVGLYEKTGFFLEIMGDEDAVQHVRRGHFVVGALWTEATAGNNAVGTVLELKRPIQIFASEHYHRFFHHETDSSAPIFNPEGEFIGGICLTGRYYRANPHTLGMVVAAAQAIENEIRTRKALRESQIAYSFQKAVITSVPEALMAIDNQNCISLINDRAKKKLFPHLERVEGKSIHESLGHENHYFLSMIQSPETITDAEVRIFTQHVGTDYTMTCNAILAEDGEIIGKIIILNEISRFKTLATNMMGAKAQFCFEDICGQNPQFLMTLGRARIISQNRANVLILGESGTGKDILAQAIHNAGDRKNGPYVAINCGAIPRDLITSELFGYSDGAYTGARRGGHPGKFELADRGTVFLDEIAETPLELQAVLLRVIEEKSIIRIGGSRVRPVDVRILAATNRDLMEEVRRGRFRKDLYYRLNVFAIHMLPLSERLDDIPLLVHCFVKKYGQNRGRKIIRIDKGVMEAFQRYDWPGNIRELQNVVERMINFAPADSLTVDLIPEEIRKDSASTHHVAQVSTPREFERQQIMEMMQMHLKKADIARKMGISRPTLYRKLEEYKKLQDPK